MVSHYLNISAGSDKIPIDCGRLNDVKRYNAESLPTWSR